MAPSLEVIHNISPTITDLDASHSICVLGASPSSHVCGEQCLRKVVSVCLNLEQKYLSLLELLVPVLVSCLGPPWFPPKSEIHADDGPPL